ncbi:MAG TPA: hypothetical protein VHB79_02305 [Polyangiaceae bacterium]|nr:hypothetical protein [Polyangiaceae bacterium]
MISKRHSARVAPAAVALVVAAAGGCSSEAASSPSAGTVADSGGVSATSAGSGSVGGSAGLAGLASGGATAGLGGNPSLSEGGGAGSGAGSVATGGAEAGHTGAGSGGAASDRAPLIDLLPLFTAPDVPARGSMEAPTRTGPHSDAEPPMRPGKGLAQHPMLYVGENSNRIHLTSGDKVVWTYDTNGGYELDDVWMLSNGNVLYSHMTYVEEVTPNKKVVWHYEPPTGEIHTVQPIGLDKVLMGVNQSPAPHLQIIDKATGKLEMDHEFPEGAAGQHVQMRRMRMTGAKTYLVGWLQNGKVMEYDQDFKVVWSYETPRPWSVARLHNGNTLIQDEKLSTCKEVDAQGTVVWSMAQSEVMVPGAKVGGNTQSCERLASGNTVLLFHSGPGNLQLVEVTPAKELVWALEDYKNLGDGTDAMFLDQPGIPEQPGATEH